VLRYNSFVESGVDADFDKPTPRHRIEKPPFYAAWATPVVHDTRAGLRVDPACQVIDMNGEVIPGLYCGGESAGGFSQHGLARAACQGYIAGRAAAAAAPLLEQGTLNAPISRSLSSGAGRVSAVR
jgi:succinate dehydrogenase/fumarate reductase flavoprotein subunit